MHNTNSTTKSQPWRYKQYDTYLPIPCPPIEPGCSPWVPGSSLSPPNPIQPSKLAVCSFISPAEPLSIVPSLGFFHLQSFTFCLFFFSLFVFPSLSSPSLSLSLSIRCATHAGLVSSDPFKGLCHSFYGEATSCLTWVPPFGPSIVPH